MQGVWARNLSHIIRCGWTFIRLVRLYFSTLHFHTGPFILKLAPGAEIEDVNIFNRFRFFKK